MRIPRAVGLITLSQAFTEAHVECPLLGVPRENSNDQNKRVTDGQFCKPIGDILSVGFLAAKQTAIDSSSSFGNLATE